MEDVVRKLHQLVPPFVSAQEMPIVTRSLRLRSGRKTYWFSWVTGIVILIVLWFVLNTQLVRMVSQLTGNH